MDPEQTFLRVHARVTGMLSQLLTPRIRTALEYIYLSVAVASFALLVVMHTNFVQQPGCSNQLTGLEISEAQLVQIKISSAGLWSQYASVENVIDGQVDWHVMEKLKMPEGNGDGLSFSIVNLFSSWVSSGTKRSKWNFKSWKSDKGFLERQMEPGASNNMLRTTPDDYESKANLNEQHTEERHVGFLISQKESLKASFIRLYNVWRVNLASFWRNLRQFSWKSAWVGDIAGLRLDWNNSKSLKMLPLDHVKSFIVQWLEKSSMANDPTYLYAKEKMEKVDGKCPLLACVIDERSEDTISVSGKQGYFLLPEAAKSRHNIRTVNVTISACDPCFGNRWQQILINVFVGYDTILMNGVLSSPGPGYLYNFQTKEFFHLSFLPEPTDGPARFGDYFVTKCSVLLMSLFVFFTTTMSVSFTLRETQSRMLKFTVQLQHHARHHLPTFKLIFVHVIESLVFVPIMIGILFFLFEFYDDQLLAFLVLTLVWLCELFTMISVRTPISMQFFPRFFLLYFLVFHIYFFSYAYGFSYLAFSATAAFMQHLILFFWNRYEVPALQRFMRNRSQLQQQAGVQITSSTILTSTLHIARVNMANPTIGDSDIRNSDQSGPTPYPVGTAEGAGTQQSAQGNLDSTERSPLIPESNRQQRDTNLSWNALNPFATLLLWILGGTSGDGLVSFFSMFRDMRDQNPVYVEHQDGNEPIT